MKEKLDDGRWLDLSEVLIGQPHHCALEGLHLPGRLQSVFVCLVLYRAGISVVDRHDQETKDANKQKEEGERGRVGERTIIVLLIDDLV